MKLYIVKTYPFEDKPDICPCVCGIYSTEHQLANCVFFHFKDFHFDNLNKDEALKLARQGKIYKLNRHAKNAQIELVLTNTWNQYGVI